jgi:hypothetical protein
VAATTGAAMTPPRLRINLSPRLIAIRLLCLPPVPPSKTQDSVGRTVVDSGVGRKMQLPQPASLMAVSPNDQDRLNVLRKQHF